MNTSSSYRIAGFFVIFHAILFFVPLGVLGMSIGWPANLDLPASHNLPLVLAQAANVKIGYSTYLVYSLLFFPAMFFIAQAIAGNMPMRTTLKIAVGFALASTLARSLGIIRWLSVMPVLATKFEKGDTATKDQVGLVYDAFNSYAGSVGEILGVFLFAALTIALISFSMMRSSRFPKWLAFIGIASAGGFAALSTEMFGLDLGAYIAPVSVIYLVWAVCTGFFMMRRASFFAGQSK